jgi:hypothetical protein
VSGKLRSRTVLYFAALFVVALLPRLYGAQMVGWNWDAPGSFTLINFDEAGSCRAALGGFDYSTFIGRQTVAISQVLGHSVADGVQGNPQAAKAYCHGVEHINVARNYAALTGALTVVVIGVIALLLVPAQPQVALTASALLALSGFHISESQTGTVDAPSVLFIYLFFAVTIFAIKRRSVTTLIVSPIFLLAAVWTKYWVFAVFSLLGALPERLWSHLGQGLSAARVTILVFATVILFALLTNAEFHVASWFPVLGFYYVLVPWKKIRFAMILVFILMPVIAYLLTQVNIISGFTTGALESNFGTGYAAIGWNKWPRNALNIFSIVIVGLGLPACIFIPAGIKAICRDRANARAWLCLAPVAVFGLYMMFIAPVTYYRHYLALIPAAALVASLGLWSTSLPAKRWFFPLFLPLFFIWPALLALDIEMDYQRDPRIELRQWYAEHPTDRVFVSYYVSPPPAGMQQSQFFRPEYTFGDAQTLKQANYLILSENWYDTTFANELNGPLTGTPERLIKTKPEYAEFYRNTLAGNNPTLELETAIDVQNFMPELIVHKWLYGTFQLFVGDLKIYKVVSK